ncbi:MAG: hypothetical protein JW801_15020 [Bacteroidales bacterium]|nr:hypothetical protein [Bacteroidales bacterium]
MKIRPYLFTLTALLLILWISCDTPTIGPGIIEGELVDHSECKLSKSALEGTETPDTLSCVEYSYDASTRILTLRHINAAFNCCPGELGCIISEEENVISIRETEEAPMCDCNCLYDLEISISGVEKDSYTIEIDELYIPEENDLSFGINLKQKTEGSVCVVRKVYPWGLNSLVD